LTFSLLSQGRLKGGGGGEEKILQREVEKVIKDIRDKKATGDDDVPGDVLILLGEKWSDTSDS